MSAFAVLVLGYFGVSGWDVAVFSVFIVFGLVLPGMLTLRALHSGERTLAEEIALALVLGYAIQVITYIGARAVGAPLLVAIWPVATYLAFLLVPGLRKHWRAGYRQETPVWWSWSIALTVAYLVAWSGASFFRTSPLTWPGLGTAHVDMSYHLALIGELKHHMPPTSPMVGGEPLFYHWFVYAHFAATSWVTGVEPLVLLFRLGMLPMFAAFVVLLGMVGRRLMNSWAGGLLAVLGTVLIAAPNLYLGTKASIFNLTPVQSWISPTETFGALLFASIVLLLLDLLPRWEPGLGRWLLLAIFIVVVMGAKAVYLPLLAAGLATVAVVQMVRARKTPWRTLFALGLTGVCFLYAQFVLFGNTRQAMMVDPLSLMRATWQGLTGLRGGSVPPTGLFGVALLYVLSWGVMWLGIVGLLARRRLLLRADVVLMLSMGVAGMSAVFLFGHPHHAQTYFLQAAYPYLVVLAVFGLLILKRRARLSLRSTVCAVIGGMAAACLIRTLCDVKVPLDSGETDALLYRPYLALAAVAILTTVLLMARRRGKLRVGALVLIMITCVGVPGAWCIRVLSLPDRSTPIVPTNFFGLTRSVLAESIPDGIMPAGRWLRSHSRPDELIATNAHCLWGYENPCDSRHFWVAALAERRVLVEGWTYTPTNVSRWQPGQPVEQIPFWDDQRMALNEAAFSAPSRDVLQRMVERYGVRWLLSDERRVSPNARVADYAKLRFRSGDYAVYEVPHDLT
ncbi:hypothetical protein ACGFNP_39800 [Nonomuraea sp. NPDC049269]|uniref:hypothetical protein n=1 Tax=Nonomuraea sp. NPDC049269 TaxID=3364349 RepID=UPI0037204BC0